MAGRSCLQDRQIAGTFGTKLEIVANQDVTRAQLAGEDVVDKMLGAERGKAAIEVADVNLIHAVRRKQFQLLAQAGEPRRCCIRAKQLARMRLERHRRRAASAAPRRRPAPWPPASAAWPDARNAHRRSCRWSRRSRTDSGERECEKPTWAWGIKRPTALKTLNFILSARGGLARMQWRC